MWITSMYNHWAAGGISEHRRSSYNWYKCARFLGRCIYHKICLCAKLLQKNIIAIYIDVLNYCRKINLSPLILCSIFMEKGIYCDLCWCIELLQFMLMCYKNLSQFILTCQIITKKLSQCIFICWIITEKEIYHNLCWCAESLRKKQFITNFIDMLIYCNRTYPNLY